MTFISIAVDMTVISLCTFVSVRTKDEVDLVASVCSVSRLVPCKDSAPVLVYINYLKHLYYIDCTVAKLSLANSWVLCPHA